MMIESKKQTASISSNAYEARRHFAAHFNEAVNLVLRYSTCLCTNRKGSDALA
jgi:hypothetical protein